VKQDFLINYSALITLDRFGDIDIWLSLINSFGKQEINDFKCSFRIDKEYEDSNNNLIGFNQFKQIVKLSISFDVRATISQKEDISTRRLMHRDEYLKSEKYLEQTNSIKELAQKITKSVTTDIDKAKAIFEFVINNFEYEYPVRKRGVASMNLTSLKGDCGEYSSLFVALCRCVGIPALNLSGYVIYPEQNKISEHAWASVYLDNRGWIDVDPQYASLKDNEVDGMENYFDALKDFRLITSKGFSIPLQPQIKKNHNYKFWDDAGLPMTSESVQILQPLVFTTTEKAKLEDQIEIKS
jgi:hypothetical protein